MRVAYGLSYRPLELSFGTGPAGRQKFASTFHTERLVQMRAAAFSATVTAINGSDDSITFTIAFRHS
jgi:hypothetical protein